MFQEFWVNLLVFCKKKQLVLSIILLPLDKILRFFCCLFTFVSTYVFNIESLNQ